MSAADSFLLRRMTVRERETGYAIRACLERYEQPPQSLREEHRAAWDMLCSLRESSSGSQK